MKHALYNDAIKSKATNYEIEILNNKLEKCQKGEKDQLYTDLREKRFDEKRKT
jgi:hypothetical protein